MNKLSLRAASLIFLLLTVALAHAQQFSVKRFMAEPESESSDAAGLQAPFSAELIVGEGHVENTSQTDDKSIVVNNLTNKGANATSGSVETQNVDMFIGQVQVLDKVSVVRVAVGSGAVIRAEVLDTGELLVIAQAQGSTSLRLWHADGQQSDYNIRVAADDPETRFQMERMVNLRVKMVEFRKSAISRLGIDWGNSIAGPTFATAGDFVSNNLYRPSTEGFDALPNNVKPFSSYFGIASSITSRINYLSSTGDAVLLAEPTLSCANGGSASFLAGGEVPYPTVGSNGQTLVEFKEYGIKLDVSPKIDTLGNIQTSVMTEISSIDPAVSVQGAPGLLTRRTQTQVNVKSGQTIVIAGLLKAEHSADIGKLPGLGRLPLLGRLFRAENKRNDASELVIFITPEAMSSDIGTMATRHQQIDTLSAKRLKKATSGSNLRLLE